MTLVKTILHIILVLVIIVHLCFQCRRIYMILHEYEKEALLKIKRICGYEGLIMSSICTIISVTIMIMDYIYGIPTVTLTLDILLVVLWIYNFPIYIKMLQTSKKVL